MEKPASNYHDRLNLPTLQKTQGLESLESETRRISNDWDRDFILWNNFKYTSVWECLFLPDIVLISVLSLNFI